MSQDAPLLYDWTGLPVGSSAGGTTCAPITGRPNTALQSTYQGGMVALGSDYGSTAKAQVPRVDSTGNLYTVAGSPAGGSAAYYTGQAAPAAASQYGTLGFMRQDLPTPASMLPFTADPIGSLNAHLKSKVTARAIMRGVTAGSKVNLCALINNSSMVVRLYELNIYITPGGTSGSLLGSSGNTYYPLICEIYRLPAANVSGGTSVSPVMCDSGDTLASGIAVAQLPTIASSNYSASSSLYRADAYICVLTGSNFYARRDVNEKSLLVRPGESMALICVSSGTVSTASGGTTTATPDIQLVFTQAAA